MKKIPLKGIRWVLIFKIIVQILYSACRTMKVRMPYVMAMLSISSSLFYFPLISSHSMVEIPTKSFRKIYFALYFNDCKIFIILIRARPCVLMAICHVFKNCSSAFLLHPSDSRSFQAQISSVASSQDKKLFCQSQISLDGQMSPTVSNTFGNGITIASDMSGHDIPSLSA